MAKSDNLADYLVDIANAIRTKKGTTEPINAQDFASEIASIESGGGEASDTDIDGLLTNSLTHLSSNATSLRAYALRGMSKLTSVDLPNVKSVGDNGFYGVGLAELSLPSCTKVGGTCIAYCASLTKLNLPKCTTLGTYAFRDNKLLSEVTLSACTTISQNAFYNCDSLAKISLPSVTVINASAFSGSATFATLILGGSSVVQLVNTNAFTGTKIAGGTGYIYVPAVLVEDYKAASNWSNYAEQIRAIEDYPEITA